MPGELALSLLGGLEISQGNAPLAAFAYAKSQALLADPSSSTGGVAASDWQLISFHPSSPELENRSFRSGGFERTGRTTPGLGWLVFSAPTEP